MLRLTPAQQDYLEAVFRLQQSQPQGVRITDIAEMLGTRLPTVTRNVRRLREARLVEQEQRGPVSLTRRGQRLGAQLTHRHNDIRSFLTDVLGVERSRAESEACVLEHALSGQTSQLLHLFMEKWDKLDGRRQDELQPRQRARRPVEFTLLGPGSGAGKRR